MACLDMYNSSNNPPSQQPPPPIPISPRISFSNDFVESSHNSQLFTKSTAPPSYDFEFSVANNSMLSADQLFCKGRILPFNNNATQTQRTLRDELLNDDADDDDDDIDLSFKPPKSSSPSPSRWKGFLGRRKSPILSNQSEKSVDSVDDSKMFAFLPHDATNLTFTSEDIIMRCEGASEAPMEKGI